jgi:hypothetical protein
MKTLTRSIVQRSVLAKGYRWLNDGKPYHLNIVAIRTLDDTANTFNDWFTYSFDDGKDEQFHLFKGTTDPGLYFRLNPANVLGTAIVKPGQYLDCWKLGMHQGKYEALVQAGAKQPLTVWRDNNKDKVLDFGKCKEYSGYFGINHHRARPDGESVLVDKWSAGCMVLANSKSFASLIGWCKQSAKIRLDNSFSFTLLDEGDLK